MFSYYDESHFVSQMSEEEVTEFLRENKIKVEGENCPRPIRTFYEAALDPVIVERLLVLGYMRPTPIQCQVLPCVMSGRDVIGHAETGSGKTLAFLLPLLQLLTIQPRARAGEGPLALIVAPTRELVEQLYAELQRLLSPPGYFLSPTDPLRDVRVLGAVGGIPLAGQIQTLSQGVDVLLATPGRLLHLASLNMPNRSVLRLDRLRYLVFDEIDRMLLLHPKATEEGDASVSEPQSRLWHGSMEEQLRRFLSHATLVPRQTLLFSATMPSSVQRLARSAVLNPIRIHIGEVGVTPAQIRQHVLFVHTYQKKAKLLEVLRTIPRPPVLIFCDTKGTVDWLVHVLRQEQFHVAGLHSEKSQAYRFRVMRAFREGQIDVLVATDLASRGIDVSDITHVILYDMPDTIEDYIHRVGRTGRAGQSGEATAFLTYECTIAKELKKLLMDARQPIPPELQNTRMFGRRVLRTEFGDKVLP
jgi:superfamily II DNA/RNA helicase